MNKSSELYIRAFSQKPPLVKINQKVSSPRFLKRLQQPTSIYQARRAILTQVSINKSFSETQIQRPAFKKMMYEDPPNFPLKSKTNERMFWKKRKIGELPVLIIIFEGVIGTYSKSSFFSEERPKFNIRENFLEGINKLKNHFYLVLVSTYPRVTTRDLVHLMEINNLFDAIYMKRKRNTAPRHTHDVSSILQEFNIKDSSSVMAVSALGIDQDELLTRSGESLIIEPICSTSKRYLTYHAPFCGKDCPVTFLIPHYSFLNQCQSFLDLAEFIINTKIIDSNFFSAFDKLVGKTKLNFTLGSSQSHPFIFFTTERVQITKPKTTEKSARRLRLIF